MAKVRIFNKICSKSQKKVCFCNCRSVCSCVSWRSDVSRTHSAGPHIQAKLSADSAESLHRVTNNRNLWQFHQSWFQTLHFQPKLSSIQDLSDNISEKQRSSLKTLPVKGETDSTGHSKVRLVQQPHPVFVSLADQLPLHLAHQLLIGLLGEVRDSQ